MDPQGSLEIGARVVRGAPAQVGLAQPHEIDPQWRSWRRQSLPLLPADWPLVVAERGKALVAERFAWDRVADALVALYEGAASSARATK